jgi:crotonobetainyl-CoA:carnitine CoA-transferase CaiB-like acyl-CoA transferase
LIIFLIILSDKPVPAGKEWTMDYPFEGLRVVESAGVLAGPAVGMYFAELGAEVTKIEPPGGDVTRSWLLPGETRSSYYSCVNWGKKTLTLDFNRPADMDVVMELLAVADVFIANFKPGSAEKLGLDYPTLSRRFPKLIYGSITGYGPTSRRAGYDAVVQAESGLMFLNAEPGGRPMKAPIAIVDVLAAHQLKAGLTAALYRREKTGKGTWVQTSLIEAGVSALINQGAAWLFSGRAPRPTGSEHPAIAPYGAVYDCADGPMILAVGNDAQFRALCGILGFDPAPYPTNAVRVEKRSQLDAGLRPLVEARRRDELLPALHAAGVPAGAVLRVEEATELAEVAHLLFDDRTGLRSVAFRFGEAPFMRPLSPPFPQP